MYLATVYTIMMLRRGTDMDIDPPTDVSHTHENQSLPGFLTLLDPRIPRPRILTTRVLESLVEACSGMMRALLPET